MELGTFRSRSEAIRKAVEFYLHKRRLEGFKKLAGSQLCDLDWEQQEQDEIDRLSGHAE